MRLRPDLVLQDFNKSVVQARQLASAAQNWLQPGFGPKNPPFTSGHHHMLVELAFLKIYLAWERFLEESFILYMMGKRPPKGRAPKRFIEPPTRDYAMQLTLPEMRKYADWDDPNIVRNRSQRFFINGEPYERVLGGKIHTLQELQVIRNAIAHRSSASQQRFEKLVRDKIGTLPYNSSAGFFLATTRPKSSPPTSFFEHYLDQVIKAADLIVPA